MHTTCPLSKVSLAFLRRDDYEWNGGAPSCRNAVQRKKRWIVNNSSEPVVAGRPRRWLAIACIAGNGAGILIAIAAIVYGVMRYSTGIPQAWWAYWLAYFLALVLTAGYLFWRGSRWVAENPYEMELGRPPRSRGRFIEECTVIGFAYGLFATVPPVQRDSQFARSGWRPSAARSRPAQPPPGRHHGGSKGRRELPVPSR